MILSTFYLCSGLSDAFLELIVIGAIFLVIISIASSKSKKKESSQSSDSNNNSKNHFHSFTASNNISQSTKQIQAHESYPIIYNDSPFRDNLNYKQYECKAQFIETNRIRTKKIEAFSEDDAINELKKSGYTDPITLTPIPFDPPTDRQIEVCHEYGTAVPNKACKRDVSYIIDKEMDHDSNPNPELLSYATEMRVFLSYYIGKKALYNTIFDQLDIKDKIAFFVFCIYRFNSNDRTGNLNQSRYKADFYKFAEIHLQDKSFIQSMNHYKGEQLRYFGKMQVGNMICEGGSKNTNAYKEVMRFLQNQGML
mgnify:CR=1 FL=1